LKGTRSLARLCFVGLCIALSPGVAITQSTGYPHEPAGFAVWSSSTLDVFTGNGWDIVNPSGNATLVADAGGSLTPSKVGQWKYPVGFAGGSAPATMYRALPGSFNEGGVARKYGARRIVAGRCYASAPDRARTRSIAFALSASNLRARAFLTSAIGIGGWYAAARRCTFRPLERWSERLTINEAQRSSS
jgi:hypothetical protein